MKKISLLIAFLVVSIAAFAQAGTFSYGVKGALNLSNIRGDDVHGTDIKVGYQVGLVSEYRFSQLFGVGPELMFSNEGWKNDGYTVNMNYINLPIMAKFHVWRGLSLNVGPQMGVCVFNHADGVKVDTDLYHKFNFGFAFGASYTFNRMFVDARYSMGLTKIFKDVDAYNYNISIGLGYLF